MPSLKLWTFLPLGLTLSCGPGASTDIKYAPDFRPGSTTVSVFGTFRNGRMDPELMAQLGPTVTSAFGPGRCDVAFSGELSRQNPELYAAIEDQAKAEGFSEELLEKVAPMAQGELLVAIAMHGAITPRSFGGAELDPSRLGPQASMRGAPRSRQLPAGALRRGAGQGGLVLTATFYAVRFHRGLAKLTMTYDGPSVEDAIAAFGQELAKVVPGSTCRGFHWEKAGKAP